MKNNTYLNFVVVSNIILEPYLYDSLCNKFGKDISISYVQLLDATDEMNKKLFCTADCILVLYNLEERFPSLGNDIYSGNISKIDILRIVKSEYTKIISYINVTTSAPVYVFTFDDFGIKEKTFLGSVPYLKGLMCSLNDMICISNKEQNTIIDLNYLIAKVGIINSYDMHGKIRWNAPYSKAIIGMMVEELSKQYLINTGQTNKCLVLDCDNVLWGGILAEDGFENIDLSDSGLGRIYKDFQRFVLSLYYHGVILTVCSKNDLSDVLTVFREHSEMILKEEHIAYFQVNWDNKLDSIRTIAEKLNIGLDSMVFVDDSPIEIEAVKSFLPGVTTILFKRDMDYDQFSCFNLKCNVNLENITKRNQAYRTDEKRYKLKRQYDSYGEYVKELNVKTEIHRTLPIEYSRVSELTQRTNKCTNGKRFTVQELKNCIENDEIECYSVHVSDRFSDLGLVGAFAVKDNDLILFSLSCRALGREVENLMIEYIISKLNIERAFFIPTTKNTNLKEALEEKMLIALI